MYSKEAFKIFVVEDNPSYLKFLGYVLSLNPDFEVELFENGTDCLNNLHKKPDLITLDYSLPDLMGGEVLDGIRTFDSHIHVIIISAQEQIGTAVELLKNGAYDYITKDDETQDRLLNSINNARNNVSLVRQVDELKKEVQEKYEFESVIIGSSPLLKKVFKLMEKAAKTNITVSVTGETGTGKEVVSKAIHYNSPKKSNPFVAVNIAAIPKDLIESELFGHEKGAFTGALARRIGKFEEAKGGSLFLDEIGEMDMNLQAKLLRVLQEKELVRIGGSETIKLDVRIIVATHRNLGEEVKKGNFREDLYYRLLGLPIELPPLRDRGNDILLLAKFFLKQFTEENQLGKLTLTNEASDKLLRYSFPGNVRELKSIVELASVLSEDGTLREDDINFNSIQREDAFISEEMTLKDYNYTIIKHFLSKYDNNVQLVADKLDIGKSSIYRYLKELEIE